ncbi:MAG: response regulator [Lachnospiraceae bacterium]|nr:response regulator [Lachnospiraceae bacterium]
MVSKTLKHERKERFAVFLTSLAAIGLLIINELMGWEAWVPVVLIIMTVLMWAVHLSERLDPDWKAFFCFLTGFFIIFYYGVHKTGLFDIAILTAVGMMAYAAFDRLYMPYVFLAEYFFLMAWHLLNIPGWDDMEYDVFSISRLLMHTLIIVFVYVICTRAVRERLEREEEDRLKNARIEKNDADMEDFLSNISHELRTPINVVNGMSDLLIKRGIGYEAEAIKNAGIRLAYQIEDIQDYTECKRNKVILENEDYMSTSLINDVVFSFRMHEREDLELVVDLNPSVPAKMNGDIKKIHKIFRHLLENAVKFTKYGGILVRMYTEKIENGVNLCIEMTDTGIGMDRKAVASVADGMYQVNKKRNRSSGGIGLGLYIVYGFAHAMGGFVKIESEKGNGSTIRVTVPQRIADPSPCLTLSGELSGVILFHVRSDKYKVPKLRDFYRSMAANLASGTRTQLYSVETVYDVERMREKTDVGFIFMGQEEYEDNKGYFDALCEEGVVVVVSANAGFKPNPGSRVLVMPKPLYAYPVIKVINEGFDVQVSGLEEDLSKPDFEGVRALIVDDEPMNLVVASGIFKDYGMVIDTAGSGKEALLKFRENDYDVIFMDHMMPEMDGVEAMKQIRGIANDTGRSTVIVALTANVVSGAREMFMREGFDGFIAKPINTADFERVMLRELPGENLRRGDNGI